MIEVPQRVLLGPGPSNVPPRVLEALGRPTIGHLDPVFLRLMDELGERLRQVFRTKNELTLAMSGTGSAGMETLLGNLIESRDRVLVCKNGVFGARMADVAERYGATVLTLDKSWGQVFEQEEVIEAVRREQPALTCLVHAETSTGAHQPLDRIGLEVEANGGLFLVDCVTSLGGAPVEVDAWHIDAAYSGTQKCLSCPPGLSPVTLSKRAEQKLSSRKTKVRSWYLDLTMIRRYWGNERVYHHTAPINMLYALHEALGIVLEEGLEPRFARHQGAHELLRVRLAQIGLHYASQEGHHLPMLNAVHVPEGVDEASVRRRLLEEHGIEIGAGLGVFQGKAWRIGLMGHNATRDNALLVAAALGKILQAG